SDSALRCRHPPTVFLFHATATPPLSTLSLHDALPISPQWQPPRCVTSAAASGTGASRPGRGKQARAIVTQLADRFVDVRMRQMRSEEHTSELQSPYDLVCRLLLEKKKKNQTQ